MKRREETNIAQIGKHNRKQTHRVGCMNEADAQSATTICHSHANDNLFKFSLDICLRFYFQVLHRYLYIGMG